MDDIEELAHKQEENNPTGNSHMLCVLEKAGFLVIKNGEVDLDYLISKVFKAQDELHDWLFVNKEKEQKRLRVCLLGVKRSTPEDTVFYIADCLDKYM